MLYIESNHMANQDKKNKNAKKVATKAPKVHGSPKTPRYEQNESSVTAPDLAPKAKRK